jgi:DNA polymerase III subunit delta'
MKFADIPYKSREKSTLIKQIKSGRIPHAQLFLGNEGCGSLALVLAYVAYIYCTDKQNDDSCGDCQSCRTIDKLIHPDLHFSFPVVSIDGKKREDTTSDDFMGFWREMITQSPYFTIHDWQQKINAGNAKPNINTKECNDIIHKLAFNSFTEGPKILVMWLPEFLGKEGNKLLKLIEEPTPETYIILIAHEADRILNTILSRCQLVKILPYSDHEIQSYLVDYENIDNSFALQYARLAEGNISKAIELSKGEDKNLSELLFEWLRMCYKGDAAELSIFIEDISSWSLDNIIAFFEYSLHFFQAYINWILTDNPDPVMTEVEKLVAKKMTTIFDRQKVEEIAERIDSLIYFINRNGNKKINLMAESITIGYILKNRQETSINNLIFAKESLLVQ